MLNKRKLTDIAKKSINDIIRQERTDLLNVSEFKILYSILQQFWNDRPNKSSMFFICIKESEIPKLELETVKNNLYTNISDKLKASNKLTVNSKFEILNKDNIKLRGRKKVNDYLINISKEGYCVFFFGPDGIDVYSKGINKIKFNIFYTTEDIQRYTEKYHIKEIDKIFERYQKRALSQQYVYSMFFAQKSALIQIDKKYVNRNILRNKPEQIMRDHLLDFLNEKTQHRFYKECELVASKRETDIYTEVDGELYLFEIKWLGRCISDCGTKINNLNTHACARNGVTQTLEYMKELIDNMDIVLKCGYLVVFDARDEKTPIDYQDFSFVEDHLKKYLKIFSKIDDLLLENKHPA